jgi:thioredoxin reductase (NADPH)
MEIKACDVAIIGGGPAGLTAGLYSARAGAKTVIIEQVATGGSVNLTSEISNFPAFIEISGQELGEKMREQTESAGAEILYDEIKSIDFASKTVYGEFALNYKALIICTGASPKKLGCPREEEFIGTCVHFCGLCDGIFYKGKSVIVVGGGNHAIEEALHLSGIAKTVTIVNNTRGFNAQQVLVEKLGNNVKVIQSHKVLSLIGGGKLTGIEIQNVLTGKKRVLDCDGVFVAIGRVPNTALFKNYIRLSGENYIIVDEKLRTNIAGVYAAGDVTEKSVRQVITACADGAVSATAAAEYIKA